MRLPLTCGEEVGQRGKNLGSTVAVKNTFPKTRGLFINSTSYKKYQLPKSATDWVPSL